MQQFTIRPAVHSDLQTIYDLIHGLARYEKREEDAFLSLTDLEYWLFEQKAAYVQMLQADEEIIGYALYYPVFASFAAEAHIHLEDMYIVPSRRHKGLGTVFFEMLAAMLYKEGYAGMEWSCLDWNDPAASFYLKTGAREEINRRYFSLAKSKMKLLSEKSDQIQRIMEMETAMDHVSNAVRSSSLSTAEDDIRKLEHYYEAQWMLDYQADEQHEIPSFLKRGVLSEDALYDLLDEVKKKTELK